jgi:hypothetical protein
MYIYVYMYIARMGKEGNSYRILVGKLKGKGSQGRPRRRMVDNNKTDLRDTGCGSVDWFDLA